MVIVVVVSVVVVFSIVVCCGGLSKTNLLIFCFENPRVLLKGTRIGARRLSYGMHL